MQFDLSDREDLENYDTYLNPVEGKTYISKPFKDLFEEENIRLVTRGIDQEKDYEHVRIKGETVLRETKGGKKIITAKVYEDSRKVKLLNIQDYTPSTGNPHKNHFALKGEEIKKLIKLLEDTQTISFDNSKYRKLTDDEIKRIDISQNQAIEIVKKNPKLFTEIIQSNITTQELVAHAYRKEQLRVFEEMLKNTETTKESDWQRFFEKNTWIFGYGLGFIFLSNLEDKKLEQYVQGYNLNSYGKEVDAVMKSRGIISSLCLVEIKKPNTKLLETDPYRAGCYGASNELAGAITQSQVSALSTINTLFGNINITDKNGNPTDERIYNYQPKSYLVIGSLSQFVSDNGVNEHKLQSFELLRKNITSPEIITFDELFERAKFIVNNKNDMK